LTTTAIAGKQSRMSPLNSTPDLALIDDDELIRITWEMVARSRRLKLFTASSFHEFQRAGIPKIVPTYVDVCLEAGEDGIAVATKLLADGYGTVFLCTGMPLDASSIPQGLKGVIGKEFPDLRCDPSPGSLGSR